MSLRLLFQRFGVAVYSFLFALAVVIFLLQYIVVTNESIKELLLNVSSDLIVVALVFFIVQLFFRYNPQELHQQQTEEMIRDIWERVSSSERDIQLLPSRAALFEVASEILDGDHWRKLRIFAPIGLWRPSEEKAKWFDTVVKCATSGKVESVQGVFGLPPSTRNGEARPRNDVQQDLKHVRHMLMKFNGVDNIALNFYPPAHASVGFGVIVFERTDKSGIVALAFSRREHGEVVDSGFSLTDREVYTLAEDWFDDRILRRSVRAFILQNDNGSFEERWDGIVRAWYGEDYLSALTD